MSNEYLAQRLTEMLAAFDTLTDDIRTALEKFDAAIALIKQRKEAIDNLPAVGMPPSEDLDNGHDFISRL